MGSTTPPRTPPESAPEPTQYEGEVSGELGRLTVAAIDTACGHFQDRMREMLAANGIESLDSETWYPVAAQRATYEQLREEIGTHTLSRIGKELPGAITWPEEVRTLPGALERLDHLHYAVHRGNAGSYQFERTGAETGVLRAETPYPRALADGIVTGLTRRFTDSGLVRTEPVTEAEESVTALRLRWTTAESELRETPPTTAALPAPAD